MMCANDPHNAGAVCFTYPVGAYLSIIVDGNMEALPVLVPTCSAHAPFVAQYLEELSITDGIWVDIEGAEDACKLMREALGMDVFVPGASVSA